MYDVSSTALLLYLLLHLVQVDIGKVATLCSLLDALILKNNPPVDLTVEPAKLHPFICTLFFFAYVWSIGGNLVEKSMDAFDSFVRDLFSDTHDVKVQSSFRCETGYKYTHKHRTTNVYSSDAHSARIGPLW